MNRHPLPGTDFAGYLRSYVEEMALGDEDPVAVLDRYHTADFEYLNDGVALDRERLAAHARPARRNVLGCHLDVHDVLSGGDRVAARYTLRTRMRQGGELATEIHLFGELAEDGRLRRVVALTRQLDQG